MAALLPSGRISLETDLGVSSFAYSLHDAIPKEKMASALAKTISFFNDRHCSNLGLEGKKIATDEKSSMHLHSVNLLLKDAVKVFFGHLDCFFESENPSDLGSYDYIISCIEEILPELSEEGELKANFLCDLGCAYHNRGLPETGKKPSDLDLALHTIQQALSCSFDDIELKVCLLRQKRQWLWEKMNCRPASEEMENIPSLILETFSQELALGHGNADDRAFLLNNYADHLLNSCNRSIKAEGKNFDPIPLLGQVIEIYREAVSLPLDPLKKMTVYRNLGNVFGQRYHLTENPEDLFAAIECYEKEFDEFRKQDLKEAFDEDLQKKFILISRILIHLCSKSAQAQAAFLDKAILASRTAIKLDRFYSLLDSRQFQLLFQLSQCLMIKNAPGDLTQGIEGFQKAFQLIDDFESNPTRYAVFLNSFAEALIKRNQPGDLNSAIDIYQFSLELPFDDENLRAEIHLFLGHSLFKRNLPQQAGQQSDLDLAIHYFHEGLQIEFADDLIAGQLLFALGDALSLQNQIDQAINAFYNGLECTFNNDLLRAQLSVRLVQHLNTRNLPAQNGALSDASCSIKVCKNALALPFNDDGVRAHLLGLKGEAYCFRNLTSYLGYPRDVSKAIEALQNALALRIVDPNLRQALNGQLGLVLRQRRQMMKLMSQPVN